MAQNKETSWFHNVVSRETGSFSTKQAGCGRIFAALKRKFPGIGTAAVQPGDSTFHSPYSWSATKTPSGL